jgi:hypothetical protein
MVLAPIAIRELYIFRTRRCKKPRNIVSSAIDTHEKYAAKKNILSGDNSQRSNKDVPRVTKVKINAMIAVIVTQKPHLGGTANPISRGFFPLRHSQITGTAIIPISIPKQSSKGKSSHELKIHWLSTIRLRETGQFEYIAK